jgi:hypothetical protein
MKYVLFVLVVGTVTVAIVIDVIVLVWWLRRAAMKAFAAIGKKLFAEPKGPFLGGTKNVASGKKYNQINIACDPPRHPGHVFSVRKSSKHAGMSRDRMMDICRTLWQHAHRDVASDVPNRRKKKCCINPN